jgi:GYD domain
MAKYLCIVTYTAEGLRGLMAKGGTTRVEAARKFVASAGGSVESFYFALGADDAYIVADLPDNVAAATPSAPSAIVSAYLAHDVHGGERRFRGDRDRDEAFGGLRPDPRQQALAPAGFASRGVDLYHSQDHPRPRRDRLGDGELQLRVREVVGTVLI